MGGYPCCCDDGAGGGGGIIDEECTTCIDGEAPVEYQVVVSADSQQHVDFIRDDPGGGIDKYCNDAECQENAGTYILAATSCGSWLWGHNLVWPYLDVLGKDVSASIGAGACWKYDYADRPVWRMQLQLVLYHHFGGLPTHFLLNMTIQNVGSYTYPHSFLSQWRYDFETEEPWGYEHGIDCLNISGLELPYIFGRSDGDSTGEETCNDSDVTITVTALV
jgi:hypothetical protein